MTERKWWRVLPLDIEEMKLDPRVAELHPIAKAGLVWMLMSQWTAEEGYLPANDEYLCACSGLRDEWPAHKRAIMGLFEVGELGLAYPPLREQWEERLELHEKQSAAARRTNEAKGVGAERSGEGGGDRVDEQNADSLYVVEECIGSVKRAYKGETEENENRTAQIGESAQLEGDEKPSAEAETDCQAGNELPQMTAPSASKFQDVPRQGARVSGALLPVPENVRYLADYAAEKLGMCPNGCGWLHERQVCDLCQGSGGADVEREPTLAEKLAAQKHVVSRPVRIPFATRDSEPEDEKQGATVRPTLQQSRLEAPTAPPEPQNEASDDADDDFVAAQRAASERAAGRRQRGGQVFNGPSRRAW